MTTRILHTSDLHLDSPLKSLALKDERLRTQVQTASRLALERMVRFCIDEEVRAVLIAGDLYDGNERSAKTAAYLSGQMERLKDAGIDVFYVKGNHDAENPISGEIALPSNVHVFGGRGDKVRLGETDIWIHGVSFRERHAPESLLPRYGSPTPGAVNIALMHTSLSGAAGHDPYAPCTVKELRNAGFDYWALGHVHKREVHSSSPWIVMPGNPQGRDIGEAGAKSATLLKIVGTQIDIEEIPTSAVEFRESLCLVEGIEDDDDVRRALHQHLRGEADVTRSDAAILRLKLGGRTPRAWHILRDRDYWYAVVSEMAEETGRLWIEELSLELDTPDRPHDESVDAIEELRRIMDELRTDEGFLQFARIELEQMIGQLPPDRRHDLVPDAASAQTLVEKLAKNAVLSMTARMRGVGS